STATASRSIFRARNATPGGRCARAPSLPCRRTWAASSASTTAGSIRCGEPREETNGFARQNWWEPVGREARMLRENVGVIDISNYAKYRIQGPGAEA